MILFTFGGIGGLINASYNLNLVVHNTAWIPGHLHLTVGTAVTFELHGHHVLARAVARRARGLWSRRLALAQVWLWFVGMVIFSNSLHRLGLMGAPRRTMLNAAPYLQSGWKPLLTLVGVGGTLLFVSALLYFLNLLLTLVASRSPRARPAGLRRGAVWSGARSDHPGSLAALARPRRRADHHRLRPDARAPGPDDVPAEPRLSSVVRKMATKPRHLRVLLATDGSPDARAAVEWLARFPLPPGSVLLVLSAVAIPPSPISFPGLEDLKQSLLAEGRRACDEAADVLRPRWPAVQVSVVEGDPREQILRTAETWRPHLAVFGRRGLGGLDRMCLAASRSPPPATSPAPSSFPSAHPERFAASCSGSTGRNPRAGLGLLAALALERDVEVDVVARQSPSSARSSLPFAVREPLRSLAAEADEQEQAGSMTCSVALGGVG